MENKKVADEGMMDLILGELPGCPERDMEPYVREKIVGFNKEAHTPPEKYDFLVEVSKHPCNKISATVSTGDISTFVRELCSLDKHYLRPE